MMDKNQITGLVLIMAMLLGYQFFFAPKIDPEKPQEKPKTTQQATATSQKVAIIDSNAAKTAAGDFASAAVGTSKDVANKSQVRQIKSGATKPSHP